MTKYSFAFVFVTVVTIALRFYTLSLHIDYQPQSTQPQSIQHDLIQKIRASDNESKQEPKRIEPKPTLKSESKQKPKLILHVGPQKTATTSIQILIQQDTKVRNALQEDQYTVISFGFREISVIYKKCFIRKADCEMWDILISRFDDAYENNNNVIWSNEELVNLPMDNVTIPLWQSLLHRWDIQVLVFYRPFHQWVYSMYLQDRKRLMYKSGGNVWKEHFGHQLEVKDFPEWLRDHRKSNSIKRRDTINANDFRDTMAVKASFEELYGSERVHVLDMMAPHGVQIEFLSNNIVNATHAVQVFKRKSNRREQNPTSLLVLERIDTDLIIVQGHRQHLGDLGFHKGKRNTRRMKLESKLKELNMTTADLPKVCVSKEEVDWLWNRTLHAQKMFSRYPMSEEDMLSEFTSNQKKWCSVDARAVLRNSTWREYLSSCEFQDVGCGSI